MCFWANEAFIYPAKMYGKWHAKNCSKVFDGERERLAQRITADRWSRERPNLWLADVINAGKPVD